MKKYIWKIVIIILSILILYFLVTFSIGFVEGFKQGFNKQLEGKASSIQEEEQAGNYLYGREGFPKDPQKARELYEKAYSRHNASAAWQLAFIVNEEGGEENHKKACTMLRESAEWGSSVGQLILATQHLIDHNVNICNKYGIPTDPQKSLDLFKKLANSGDVQAQYILSYLYSQGIGVPKDNEKAYSWLQQAAKNGYQPAKDSLAQGKKSAPDSGEIVWLKNVEGQI